MKAVVYSKPRDFQVVDIPTPAPSPGKVLIKVLMAGVCGTDLHLHVGEFGPAYPLTPGHEIQGEVVGLGTGVSGLSIGQRVVVDNAVGCHECFECRRGHSARCPKAKAQGVNAPGGFAEFIVAGAAQCYVVDDLDPDVAMFTEPLSCVVHGIDMLDPRPGSQALVFGAGPTGLLLAQMLKANGACDVVMAAPTRFKLDLAESLGLKILQVDRNDPHGSLKQLRALARQGFDIVADATGQPRVLAQAMDLVRDAGTVLVYGVAEEGSSWEVNPYDVFRRELTIKGSFSQSAEFDRSLRWLRSGRITTEGIITHRFALDDYSQALKATADSGCLKAVIVP